MILMKVEVLSSTSVMTAICSKGFGARWLALNSCSLSSSNGTLVPEIVGKQLAMQSTKIVRKNEDEKKI